MTTAARSMFPLTVRIPSDLRSALDRWCLTTNATDEIAVQLALRIMLQGEPHPPTPLTKIKVDE